MAKPDQIQALSHPVRALNTAIQLPTTLAKQFTLPAALPLHKQFGGGADTGWAAWESWCPSLGLSFLDVKGGV